LTQVSWQNNHRNRLDTGRKCPAKIFGAKEMNAALFSHALDMIEFTDLVSRVGY
jgi:hypothetical protein